MSIRDSLRVIAAEKQIADLRLGMEVFAEEMDRLDKRLEELNEKLDAMLAVAAQPRPAQTPQPRPPERR